MVKNEELTYNKNAGFSLMGTKRRHTISNSTLFLFNWMPQQLSFIVLTLSLVFLLNYLSIIQSIFAPNIRRVRYKVSVGAIEKSFVNDSNDDHDDNNTNNEQQHSHDDDLTDGAKQHRKLSTTASVKLNEHNKW